MIIEESREQREKERERAESHAVACVRGGGARWCDDDDDDPIMDHEQGVIHHPPVRA